jgi:hypothetical protein
MPNAVVVDVPVWKLEAVITGLLTQPELDELLSRLLAQSRLDAEHGRILTAAEVAPYAGEASGHLAPDGAVVEFLIGAGDANHSLDRAKQILREKIDECCVHRIGVTFEVTSTWVMGEVDPRRAFEHHIASAFHELSVPYTALAAVRGHIDAALVYADSLGQETTGLQTIITDVDALRAMLYETSQPLIHRLAEVEAGTRG